MEDSFAVIKIPRHTTLFPSEPDTDCFSLPVSPERQTTPPPPSSHPPPPPPHPLSPANVCNIHYLLFFLWSREEKTVQTDASVSSPPPHIPVVGEVRQINKPGRKNGTRGFPHSAMLGARCELLEKINPRGFPFYAILDNEKSASQPSPLACQQCLNSQACMPFPYDDKAKTTLSVAGCEPVWPSGKALGQSETLHYIILL